MFTLSQDPNKRHGGLSRYCSFLTNPAQHGFAEAKEMNSFSWAQAVALQSAGQLGIVSRASHFSFPQTAGFKHLYTEAEPFADKPEVIITFCNPAQQLC